MKAKPKSILSLLCLLALTSFITGCGETVIDAEQKQERSDGLVYTVNQESPFTGVVVNYYENGQKYWEERYKNGLKHGTRTEWSENGQKREEGMYKDGERDGKFCNWGEGGEKYRVRIYKDGELIEEIYQPK